MSVEYTHSENIHTLEGPKSALPHLFSDKFPSSVLDVGCGAGTWMKAMLNFGITDVTGIEGVHIPPEQLYVPAETILHRDLTKPWNLEKKFDAVICLEVAEHLDITFATTLIDALVRHGDLIYFSAASPGQPGQHHVNCQWPVYWQKLFNERGFICEDTVRWRIWNIAAVEPWYKQNIFTARLAPEHAGKEPRISPVIHPEMLTCLITRSSFEVIKNYLISIEGGCMPAQWYLKAPFSAFFGKIKRNLK